MSSSHNLGKSFSYAWTGIKSAFREEPNFRIHAAAASLAIILGLYFHLSRTEWLVICLTIASVVGLELVNTAIEALVNLISPQIHPLAQLAKDTCAAAVLVGSISAVIVGLLIFVPKIATLIQTAIG